MGTAVRISTVRFGSPAPKRDSPAVDLTLCTRTPLLQCHLIIYKQTRSTQEKPKSRRNQANLQRALSAGSVDDPCRISAVFSLLVANLFPVEVVSAVSSERKRLYPVALSI